MKPHHLVVGLLIAACCLADIALISYLAVANATWPHPAAIFGLGFFFAQLALLSAWFVLGRWNIVVRLLLLLSALYPLSLFVGACVVGDLLACFTFLLLFATTVVALLAAVSLLRFEIAHAVAAREAHVGGPAVRRWQFSIFGAMSATTAIAILLGLVTAIEFPPQVVISSLLFCIVTAIVAVSTLVAAFHLRLITTALTIVPISALAGGALSLIGFPPSSELHVGAMMAVHSVSLAAFVYLLRACGYRLQRAAATTTEAASTTDGNKDSYEANPAYLSTGKPMSDSA